MPRFSRIALPLLVVAVALPTASCSRNKIDGDTQYVARDVNTLYALGQRYLRQGNYILAGGIFQEVERQHPYSVWARRAMIMSAFSFYMGNQYGETISAARRFLNLHPGNKDAPYAHYLIGMSYYQQIEDVNRDQKITQQAADAFNELRRRYPGSRYSNDARLKLDLITDHLAGKEMEVGRFYQREGKWLAATIRFRNVIDKYQTTSHVPEALERLVESYLALGMPGEARKAAAVLGRNYPDSKWYERSYELIQRHSPQS